MSNDFRYKPYFIGWNTKSMNKEEIVILFWPISIEVNEMPVAFRKASTSLQMYTLQA